MKILIIGTGYVGAITGTCFAEMGYKVTCLDKDQNRIDNLLQGIIPMYEPGLEEMLKRNLKAGRLDFTTEIIASIAHADICFIAVDTPMSADGAADTSQVENVAHMLGENLDHSCIVVTKSTVPVGTTYKIDNIIHKALQKRKLNIICDVVSNPEFLKEGNAVADFMKPDRIVIGASSKQAIDIMKELYAPFMLNHNRLLVMDVISAELAKYAANAMLATRISFMNQMAALCEKMGANINDIRHVLGSDERIGHHFLYPGVGYGGSCLPKDVKALIHQGQQQNCDLSVLRAVDQANQDQKRIMRQKLLAYFGENRGLKGKTIGILGLAFKPNTDDMREASSLTLINELIADGANVRLFDPIAMPKAKKLLPALSNIHWCEDEYEAAQNVDALVLMTEWKQFRLLDFSLLLQQMRGKAFFDGRNQYQPDEMHRKGFDYFGIGCSLLTQRKDCKTLYLYAP